MIKFWQDLTKYNWGLPYHYIRMLVVFILLFDVFGIESLLTIKLVVAGTFFLTFIEQFVQYWKTNKWEGEVQDFIADVNGIALGWFATVKIEGFVIHWWDVVGLFIISGFILYFTEYTRKSKNRLEK